MDDRISITITTDKPVKIRVSSQNESEKSDGDGKEAAGVKRLLREVKGGSGHVVSKRETRRTGTE